jgi:hypothetical protein
MAARRGHLTQTSLPVHFATPYYFPLIDPGNLRL